MIGTFLRTSRRVIKRAGLAALVSLALVATARAPAAAQSLPYYNEALRWIGRAPGCVAPQPWLAERLFRGESPPGLADLCLYTWQGEGAPSPAQVNALFAQSRATQLTEDVPVVAPSAPMSSQEQAVLAALRTSLRVQVGDASLLPVMPERPAVRVVVLDSAPDAAANHIRPGASRHGDTLAHLIEDVVCRPSKDALHRACAAEVTTVLALPWIARGVIGPSGGYAGTLADLARAIERALATWQADRRTSPSTTPPRLVLNLSLGWEDTPVIADCTTDPRRQGLAARAVRGILQQAAAQGALIVAAAGNDSGGPTPRTGLICPARYQGVPQDADPGQPLVIAASGVDYQDHPLETVRPQGLAELAGLALGGVAWAAGDPVPPQLVGSSVSAAVVSAVAAVVWADQPGRTPAVVVKALRDGGVAVSTADQCLWAAPCVAHRVSVCGALHAAGTAVGCAIPSARVGSSPALPAEVGALLAQYAAVPLGAALPATVRDAPRFAEPTVQVEPTVFPQPISGTCPTCVMSAESATSQGSVLLPALDQPLDGAMLIGRSFDGSTLAVALGALAAGSAHRFQLPSGWVVNSAYLTGFDINHYSVTVQVLVQ